MYLIISNRNQAVNDFVKKKKGFFKRFSFQKKRFLMPEKGFFTACILK